jgi:hypothetical protein
MTHLASAKKSLHTRRLIIPILHAKVFKQFNPGRGYFGASLHHKLIKTSIKNKRTTLTN